MVLDAKDVDFWYHAGRPVLRSVACGVPSGQITALLGPNGSGKTTLLRLLLGLRRPRSGDVLLDGRPVWRRSASERAARLAYVAQRPSVAFTFNVRQVVALGRHGAGDAAAVDDAMARAGIVDLADEVFGELSVGQQHLVAIARAVAQLSPGGPGKVLLADEPLSALDPAHAGRVLEIFIDLARAGVAVGVVIHDVTTAVRISDRVIVLDAIGSVAGTGPTGEVCTPEVLARVYGVSFSDVDGHLLPALPMTDRI